MLFGDDDHRVVDLAGWVASSDELVGWVGRRFARAEPRVRVRAYVRGLLAGLERKNGWTLAEHAGAVSADGMRRLLRTADRYVEGVRDECAATSPMSSGTRPRRCSWSTSPVRQEGNPLGRGGPPVHRHQGKIDNCQVGVFRAYASSRGGR
jgi:hypothetical protein